MSSAPAAALAFSAAAAVAFSSAAGVVAAPVVGAVADLGAAGAPAFGAPPDSEVPADGVAAPGAPPDSGARGGGEEAGGVGFASVVGGEAGVLAAAAVPGFGFAALVAFDALPVVAFDAVPAFGFAAVVGFEPAPAFGFAAVVAFGVAPACGFAAVVAFDAVPAFAFDRATFFADADAVPAVADFGAPLVPALGAPAPVVFGVGLRALVPDARERWVRVVPGVAAPVFVPPARGAGAGDSGVVSGSSSWSRRKRPVASETTLRPRSTTSEMRSLGVIAMAPTLRPARRLRRRGRTSRAG